LQPAPPELPGLGESEDGSPGKGLVEVCSVHIIADGQIRQVAEFVALRQVIYCDDVGDPTGIQPLDDVAAYESGCPGNHNPRHTLNSW
jgi:hypothetical protein